MLTQPDDMDVDGGAEQVGEAGAPWRPGGRGRGRMRVRVRVRVRVKVRVRVRVRVRVKGER